VTLHSGAGRSIARALPYSRRFSTRGGLLSVLAIVALVIAGPVRAQGGGDGFLFHAPIGSFTLRGGFAHATAGSDLFSFVANELTLRRRDFSSPTVGADLAFRITPRLDAVLGATYAGTSTRAEYRHFVGTDNLPIEQTTSFRRVPVTASLKAYLLPRGRSIGQFAWVPTRYAPYIGIGGGGMWYRFRQKGDFVVASTNAINSDDLVSDGWTLTGHAMGGLDVSLGPRFALTGEGRYTWAKATLSDAFTGFQPIDLSGFAVTAGVSVRF
jgi:opacity protein-like surface antigen